MKYSIYAFILFSIFASLLNATSPIKHTHKQNGIYKEYYKNGLLKKETPYKNNRKNGLEKRFSREGTLDIEIHYKMGKKDGTYRVYDERGRIWAEIEFQNDKAIHGIAYTESGKKVKISKAIFHKLGFEF